MSKKEIQASGQCLCGKVDVKIDAVPFRMAQCHCRDCQKISGGGHMSLAFFSEEGVTITGETASYASTTDSGNTTTRHFCSTCGSRISGVNTVRPGVIGIPIGILDQRDWFAPQAIVYCKNRDEWDKTRDDIPNFDAMPQA